MLLGDSAGRALVQRINRLGRSQNATPILATQALGDVVGAGEPDRRVLLLRRRDRRRGARGRSRCCGSTPTTSGCASSSSRSAAGRCLMRDYEGRVVAGPGRPRRPGAARRARHDADRTGRCGGRVARALAAALVAACCRGARCRGQGADRSSRSAARADAGADAGARTRERRDRSGRRAHGRRGAGAGARAAPDGRGRGGAARGARGLLREPRRPLAALPPRAAGGAAPSCRAAGSATQRYPVSNYGLDVQVDTGVTKIEGNLHAALHAIVGAAWLALVYLVKGVLLAFEWAFSLDLLNEALGGVRRALDRLHRERARHAVVHGRARGRRAVGAVARARPAARRSRRSRASPRRVGLMVAALVVINNPTGTVGHASRLANDASLGFMAAATGGSVDRPTEALGGALTNGCSTRSSSEPWCALQFGDVDWCTQRPRRLPQRRPLARVPRRGQGARGDLHAHRGRWTPRAAGSCPTSATS